MRRNLNELLAVAVLLAGGMAGGQEEAPGKPGAPAAPRGWLSWRGPQQNGTSLETGLPDRVSTTGEAPSWVHALSGRGTPVIAGGRVFAMGYEGEGPGLREVLVCLEEKTGRRIWAHHFNEFLSDVVYHRFSIGSPAIDPRGGNVFCLTSAGLLSCLTPDGRLLWQRCLMSEFGRLTFPNGRTGSPVVDGDLVIVLAITSAWGAHGPARDRFYAFDTATGAPVWSSAPGGPPQDNSLCLPVLDTENGRRVLYAGLGSGEVACVDVRTGDPLWRFAMATGGLNSCVLVRGDAVIAVHGRENLDASTSGRMVAIRRGGAPAWNAPAVDLGPAAELWRNDLNSFSSSPVLAGDRVYLTGHLGELDCADAATGKVLWSHKLGPDQLHASPVWADGKLYVPITNGTLFIIKPTDEKAEVLQEVKLDGECNGAPAIANGRIYVHTTKRLYCFAGERPGEAPAWPEAPPAPKPGAAVRLQIIPADIVLRQGETVPLRVRSLDAAGVVVSETVDGVTWTGLPEKGLAAAAGRLEVARDARPGAFVVKAEAGGLAGPARWRVVPAPPWTEDFESTALKPLAREPDVKAGPAPPWWAGAGPKWDVRERDGQKVLAKTLDNPLFQRTMSFMGHPETTGCTVQADILSDGNRRTMSSGGLINQRYQIVLKGNHQELEVSSNMELLKETVAFPWKAGVWYRLKTRVDLEKDGRGTVRAKAWPRDEPEPAAWTLEVAHANAHTRGSPGVYGFTPQSRFRVYIDNIVMTPHE